ncbi:hypothetical protein RFI_06545 [Reticulomyxa filosa]|uniref:Uncharacterized protein n=1 Tax=Reticulomyxa filosa TaxID=46433 RepID=X6NXM6_RETFI|nr:hypothetical protein RFI_06545 [Reticulomyxa filosa]|eukprot:ETO30574.1 hypothetical protein RFI_06545 [Reticulomyxa filosa]
MENSDEMEATKADFESYPIDELSQTFNGTDYKDTQVTNETEKSLQTNTLVSQTSTMQPENVDKKESEWDPCHSSSTKPMPTSGFQSARKGLDQEGMQQITRPANEALGTKNIEPNLPKSAENESTNNRKRKLSNGCEMPEPKRQRIIIDSSANGNNSQISLQDFDSLPDYAWEECDTKVLQYKKDKEGTVQQVMQ